MNDLAIQVDAKQLVKTVIERFKRLNPELTRTMVALSGGADSVALLYCLSRIKELDLCAVHIMYDIRPEEQAGRDRQVAIEAATKCDVDILTKRVKMQEWMQDKSEKNLEAAARNARYYWLENLFDLRLSSAPNQNFIRYEHFNRNEGYIATAHHADDQLETVLMFLMRGTGLRGMAGIAPKQQIRGNGKTLVRPMLDLTHEEAKAICEYAELNWAEDETNNDTDLTRNKIRHEIVPRMREINPKVAQHFVNSADIARSALETVEEACAHRIRPEWGFCTPGVRESTNTDSLRLVEDVVIYEWLGTAVRSITGGRGLDRVTKRMLDEVTSAIRERKYRKFDWPGVEVHVGQERVTIQRASQK